MGRYISEKERNFLTSTCQLTQCATRGGYEVIQFLNWTGQTGETWESMAGDVSIVTYYWNGIHRDYPEETDTWWVCENCHQWLSQQPMHLIGEAPTWA